jgi:hypothetical protein
MAAGPGFAGALPARLLMRGAGAIPGAARAAVARLRAWTGIASQPRRLRPGLEHGVERRLAGPPEAGQARLGDHVPDPGLAGLGAECQSYLLR